jgi:hypothetical protein
MALRAWIKPSLFPNSFLLLALLKALVNFATVFLLAKGATLLPEFSSFISPRIPVDLIESPFKAADMGGHEFVRSRGLEANRRVPRSKGLTSLAFEGSSSSEERSAVFFGCGTVGGREETDEAPSEPRKPECTSSGGFERLSRIWNGSLDLDEKGIEVVALCPVSPNGFLNLFFG